MQTLARFAVTRRWLVVLAWIGFIALAQGLASAAGGSDFKDTFRLPHTETQTVFNLLRDSGLSNQTGQNGTMVLLARQGTLQSEPAGLQDALQELCTGGWHVTDTRSPWGSINCAGPGTAQGQADPSLLSKDGQVGQVVITWEANQNGAQNFLGVYDALNGTFKNSDSVQAEFTGDAFGALQQRAKGVPPEVIGFLAAFVILALVFRALFPTILPLVSATAAMGAGLGIVSLLSHVVNVASFSEQLMILMVLGVGVDYALFIVTRHRRNLLAGMSVEESIVVAVNTSGRAVFFAGCTVCIAILGLWLLGVSFLYGVATATAIGVALTMLASLTLMPALLGFIGLRVLPRGARSAVRDGTYRHDHHATRWAGWSRLVQQHKLVLSLAAAAVMVTLAVPFFSMRIGHADQGNDPSSSTTRKGYDLIAQHFGVGYNSTLELVVSAPDGNAGDQTYLRTVAGALATVPDVDVPSIRPAPLTRNVAFVSFKTTTSPQNQRTTALVHHLRNDVLPPLYRSTDKHIYVFGNTAVYVDFSKVLASKMPLFFAAVVGLSFLLLMVAFRSIVIPLTAAVMNLLAAGASFGIVVAIFQWGWFSNALGIGSGGPIEAFAPVMFFAILFGLSMDYQVFLVSRMHEEWIHRRDNTSAIAVGQAETGGIITAAALIMIAVFGGFILGDGRVIKLFGIGLAGAIFVDAFILRTVLVPALMHLAGKWNWWFPGWLDKVTPHVSVEPEEEAEPELARV